MYSTREIKTIIRDDLDNWLRWGYSRDWMPKSFGSILGQLYKPRLGEGASPEDEAPPPPKPRINELDAIKFERAVVTLPEDQRAAFVIYYLKKATKNGRMVEVKDQSNAASLLGVGRTKYHEIINIAHMNVWRGLGR